MKKQWTMCDFPNCGNSFEGNPPPGWRVDVKGKDYCQEHWVILRALISQLKDEV